MNLRRIRVTLTLWYMAVLVAIVVLITVPSYLLLTEKLNEEADETLYSSAEGIAGQLSKAGTQAVLTNEPDEELFPYVGVNRGDFFYAVLDRGGRSLLNPLDVDLSALARQGMLQQAADKGASFRTIPLNGTDYRVLLLDARAGDEEGFVAVGRSDAEHQRELDHVLLFIAGSGLAGIALALVGGWHLGGRALQPARVAFERQKEFVADASHELRTPLTIIRTNAEAIATYGATSLAVDDRAALEDIVSESARMSDLVEDLLTLARLDARETVRSHIPFDLVECARSCLRSIQPLADTKRLQGELVAPPCIDVHSDEQAVNRVVRILLENAVEYSPREGQVNVTCFVDGRSAVVEVSDEGPGVPSEALGKVFERFYRGDPARDRGGGSGLGLAIARSLVEEVGGEIQALNGPSRGAVFTFSIPVAGDRAS